MDKRILLAAAVVAAVACGGEQAGPLGTLAVTLTQAPPDALCLQLTVTGATRSVTKGFDLSAGQATASLALSGLPTGSVLLSGAAWNAACAAVTGASVATWVALARTVTVPGAATLVLQRNGQETVTVDFQDDQVTVGTLSLNGAVPLSVPNGVVADNAGHLFVSDSNHAMIKQITLATGAVSVYSSDPLLDVPSGLALDAGGNLYVANTNGCNVLKIAPGGATSVFAGQAPAPYRACYGHSPNGPGFQFAGPIGLAIAGGNLYVTDFGAVTVTAAVDQISLSTGAVSVVAGLYGSLVGFADVDGPGSAARFVAPGGITADASNLYLANDATIRQISLATFNVTTLAGRSGASTELDGFGGDARFASARGIVADGAGNLFITDYQGPTVRRLWLPDAAVVTLAGTANLSGQVDGPGATAQFHTPSLLSIDAAGTLYLPQVLDGSIRTVRR